MDLQAAKHHPGASSFLAVRNPRSQIYAEAAIRRTGDPFPLQQSTSSILHPTRYFAIQNRGFSKMAAERGGVLKRPQQRLGVAIFDSLLREY